MCPSSVWRPSAGNDSFEEFADHWTMNPRPCWFTLSLRPGSTIAICYWPEHQSLLTTTWSGSWTLQRELWAAGRSTTAAWHTCFTLSYISMMWQIESHTYIHTYIHIHTGWRIQVLAWPGTGYRTYRAETLEQQVEAAGGWRNEDAVLQQLERPMYIATGWPS